MRVHPRRFECIGPGDWCLKESHLPSVLKSLETRNPYRRSALESARKDSRSESSLRTSTMSAASTVTWVCARRHGFCKHPR